MSECSISPVDDLRGCLLCDEGFTEDDLTEPMPFINADHTVDQRNVHRECVLRAVAGGIGHWLDHAYWCMQMHDPDGGRSYRQSAREVAVLLRERIGAE